MRIALCFVIGLVFSFSIKAQVAQGVIKGRLITEDDQPAGYVTLYLKDTKQKTLSNDDGYYIFTNVPEGNYTVITSFVGLQSKSQGVSIKPGETKIIDFKLKENSQELQEVIVSTGKSLNDRKASIGKMPVALRELPQSAVVVGEALLRNQQSQRLSDVIKNVNCGYLC